MDDPYTCRVISKLSRDVQVHCIQSQQPVYVIFEISGMVNERATESSTSRSFFFKLSLSFSTAKNLGLT